MKRSPFSKLGQHPERMGAQQGIYKDVEGAPFRIGDTVKVVSLSDDTADEDLLGSHGSVLYFEYSCGCGQTFPRDPMIGVLFGERTAEFWKEELARSPDGGHNGKFHCSPGIRNQLEFLS